MSKVSSNINKFYRQLTDYYTKSGRHDMLWRHPDEDATFDPYKILVSEMMLQQTQVDRVAPKYAEFIWLFPDTEKLVETPLGEVLTAWNGLGYNRRAKFLWQSAMTVQLQMQGKFPDTFQDLQKLPGVGPSTAAAIMAYAHNKPVAFVETNIRTVIIHHFFQDLFRDGRAIEDSQILAMLEEIIAQGPPKATGKQKISLDPKTNAREFYWAMMDYGTHIKKTVGNLNRASKSYTKQSTFKGSSRELRGKIIRIFTVSAYALHELQEVLQDERVEETLASLMSEGLVVEREGKLQLAS